MGLANLKMDALVAAISRKRFRTGWTVFIIAFFLVFVILPTVYILSYAFTNWDSIETFVLDDPATMNVIIGAISSSFQIAGIVTVIDILVGLPMAWMMVRKVQDGVSTVELRNGGVVQVAQADQPVGDAVVISVRPEFVFSAPEGMRAKVNQIIYMGTYWRIVAMTEDEEEVCFDTPALDGNPLTIGKELYLAINPKAAVLYPRPENGVEEAIKLE